MESEDAEDYALAEAAEAAYETALAQEALLRRRWELTIDAGDRTVRRDGQASGQTGRQLIASLWDAWELGTELDYKDIDNDADAVTYLVRIVDIEEKALKPADAARWGESLVTLILEESSPGAVQGSVHGHTVGSLSDVDLTGLADGQVLVYDSATLQWVSEAPAVPSSMPPGSVCAFAGLVAPGGWLPCDGAAVSRTTYAALFTAIGTEYGAGDGATTFNVPNGTGRVVVGLDGGQPEFDALGETGGTKSHRLTGAESGIAAHSHLYTQPAASGTSGAGPNLNHYIAGGGVQTGTAGPTEAAAAHTNLQPYLVLHWMIKT